MIDRKKLFSSPEMKGRGWTDAAIKKFAAEHDDERVNPHRKSGPPMKLYLMARVKRIELRKTWIAWQAGSTVRKQSSAEAVHTKKEKLQEYVDSIVIEVPQMTEEELTSRAIMHYNDMRSGTEKDRAYASSSRDFLDRISVNYLRHELTKYEQHLGEIASKTGAVDCRTSIRRKVYDAIKDAYPDLGFECFQQMKKRDY